MSNIRKHLEHGKMVSEAIEKMPKLAQKKNILVAGVLGFLFGGIGIGLYFESWLDFFVCIGLLILLTILIPGVGAVPGWLFASAYGMYRAHTSNEKHH